MRALTALFSLFFVSLFFKLLPLPAQVPLAHEDPDLAFYSSSNDMLEARNLSRPLGVQVLFLREGMLPERRTVQTRHSIE
jgi:hypothetical protein